MKLIHRYDNREDKWFDELYIEDELIKKEESDIEPEYDLFQKVQLNGGEYIVTHTSHSPYSEIRLIVEFEKYQDYLDKIILVKCDDGEYRTVKEQKEMRLSEFAETYMGVELTSYQKQIADELENKGKRKDKVRESFQKMARLHGDLLKRLKD